MKPLAGRMWWSFYESDATFEAFVTRALAYVSRRPRQELERLPLSEQTEQLLQQLHQEAQDFFTRPLHPDWLALFVDAKIIDLK